VCIVLKSGAALLELSRPECGTVVGMQVPPDVRFAGKTCIDESSALVDQINRATLAKSEECRNEEIV